MKPQAAVDLSVQSETTFLTKPDAPLSVGGCLFGVCRDGKTPKIASGNTPLTDSRLVGLTSERSLYVDCRQGLPNACGCQEATDDSLSDTYSFNKIINDIERLRLGLEDIERNAEPNASTMDETRLQHFSFRNPNFKSSPPKLSLAPNFQLTKLTKVAGPPLSPLPTSLPCSPVPNRSPVRLKPELPYQLTLGRKDEKSTKYAQNDDSDTGDLEEIRSILSGLDLNKYKRRKGPEGCADSKLEKPNFCRSVSNLYPMSSTDQCPSSPCPSTPGRTKLRELTDLLNKSNPKESDFSSSKENYHGKSLNDKGNATHRLVTINKRSISVPGNAVDDFQSSSRSTIKLQPITGSATLPRRRVSPPYSLPVLSTKNHNITTLSALSLAIPGTAALNNNDITQNKATRSYSGRKFPIPPPKIQETEISELTNRPRAYTEPSALRAKLSEMKMLTPSTGKKQQIAVKPLNFMFADPRNRQTSNGHLDINSSSEDGEQKPKSVSQCLSLVPISPSVSTPSISGNAKLAETFASEDNKGTIYQRRYFKKKLRGPYGEMLEEEMKKSESRPKTNHNREFQIVKELCQLQDESLYSSSYSLDESRINPSDNECHQQKTSDITNKTRNQNQLALPGILSTSSEPNLTNKSNGLTNKVLAISEGPFESHLEEDTRTHIVRELHCTERSYVESLEILVNKYMKALKCADYLEASLVDEIFYQVPRILEHHLKFLETLEQRIDSWHPTQTIGDIFTQTFSQKNLIEIYTAFINNWRSAKERIKAAVHMKPAFGRFLEHMSREHKGKLTIDALLIMPVQRIPRYELLIRELLKNTPLDHPDHHLLSLAQREVHDLAMKINQVELETVHLEQTLQKLREIDNLIDGAVDLVQPERVFICYALVTIPVGFGIKKDRGLFLFSDLLLITSIKRKSGTGRKSSSPTNNPVLFGSLEANKYKLLTKVSLENLDIVKNISSDSLERRVLSDIDHLEEDLAILGQISDLLSTLTTSHQILDDALQELQGNVSKQLVERQTGDTQLLTLELNAITDEGIEKITIIFPTCEKRISWENAFIETKQKYACISKKTHLPDFLYYLPVRKTRAGLQFTCATPTLGINQYGYRDVWVCNSDGYVGQVCILTLQPEPNITSCNGICNSRILCIVSAPEYYSIHFSESNYNTRAVREHLNENDHSTKRDSLRKVNNSKIQLESDSSEEEEENILDKNDRSLRETENSGALCIQECSDTENWQSTMWLGTEDGCILVYSCSENIRIKKTKTKIQHSSSVCFITYLDNQVFASLGSGELVVYSRKQGGIWNFDEPTKFSLGSNMCPINQMLGVNGKLWCGYQNYIKVLNCDILKVEHTFQVSNDPSRSVISMVLCDLGIWIALKYSPTILLYHATTCEYLLDVSVVPAVSKILAGCDDIIQQHKSACLRVTALLTCKDLLWIGTSAGIVLTMPLSSVTSIFNCTDNINIFGVSQGHTGHVRFLTCVETSMERHNSSDVTVYNHCNLNSSETFTGLSSSNKVLVISGGDGYEDFQNGYREAAGHDDSTNHLLLWHV